MPYTYRIGWSKHNKYYYGVRYAKGCCPTDLWTKYFTSSKHVKKFSEKYGEPDILEIRRTFSCSKEAREREHKAIKRANLVENTSYLNYTNNRAIPTDKRKKFKDLPEETKREIKRRSREQALKMHKEGRITYQKPQDTTNYRRAALARWSNPDFKSKFIGQRWMFKGGKTKKISPSEWDLYLKNGWNFGRGG